MKRFESVLVAAGVGLALLAACGPRRDEPVEPVEPTATTAEVEEPAAATGATATATLQSNDPEVSGTITFTEEAGGVRVAAHVRGVPAGKHGLHTHEHGDCSAHDYTSAGGHFNPANTPHGCPPDANRHAGDFGNIEVGADGTGHLELTTDALTLGEGANSIVGKAIILHTGEDDCATQPTGNAGDRLACGVVAADGGAAAATVTPAEPADANAQ